MDKIYEDANEQHVRAFIIYKKANQTKAYADSTFETQLTTSELKNLFIKGAVIKLDSGDIVKPIKYTESSNIGSVQQQQALISLVSQLRLILDRYLKEIENGKVFWTCWLFCFRRNFAWCMEELHSSS